MTTPGATPVILLKFFSGPHMGAEIPLRPGDTVLGSGESCDIILHDSTVATQHTLLVVPAGPEAPPALTLRTLDAPVLLLRPEPQAPGLDQPEEPAPEKDKAAPAPDEGPRPFQGELRWGPARAVMLGTTCMAWQVQGQPWGDIGPAAFLEETGPRPGQEPGAEEPGAQPAPAVPGARARRLVLLALGLLALLYLSVTFSGGPDTHLAREMGRVLKDKGFEYLTVSQTSIGVTIQGEVPEAGHRKALWELAGGMSFPVFIDVQVREERAQGVRVALAVRGLFPHVALDAQDVLLTGYFRDKLIEGAAKIWIAEDIRTIGEVRSSMVYAAQVWPLFRDALIRHELDELVVVRLHPGVVEVEGELDFEQRERLELAKKEVCDALNSPVAFWDTLTAPGFSAEWNKSISSSHRSAFAPDAGLAQLFRDAQELRASKGLSSAPALRAGPGASVARVTPVAPLPAGEPAPGPGHIDLSKAPVLDNALGGVVALVPTEPDHSSIDVLRDEKGKVVRDEDKRPLLEREGFILRDDEGRNITGHEAMTAVPAPAPDAPIAALRDEQGEVVRDEQGRPLLERGGEVLRDTRGHPVPGPEALADGAPVIVARDDKGQVLRDAEDRPLLERKPERLRDEAGRPVPGPEVLADGAPAVVARDEQGAPVLQREGQVLHDERGRPVPAPEAVAPGTPVAAARDDKGEVVRDTLGRPLLERPGGLLRDEQGQPVPGHEAMVPDTRITVARDEEDRVVRDDKGRPLLERAGDILRDSKDRPVPGRDDMFREGPAAVILERDGSPVQGADQAPLVVQALRDETGDVLRDEAGTPMFPTVARDAKEEVLRDEGGTPVLLGPLRDDQGRVVLDAERAPVPTVVARDPQDRVVRDAGGAPLVVAPRMDAQGRIVRDEEGRPVAPRIMTGADGRPARAADGALIQVPEDATDVGADATAPAAGPQAPVDPAKDYRQFGSGMGFADEQDKDAAPEDILGGLTIVGVTLEPVPFISMKDGQKYFTGGRLPGGFIIREITAEKLVVERDGKVVTRIFERRE
ncbi:type III secretion system inner membrane ring subunit SctD [Desulfocurvus vexinensis]|uniref:type III secretion system inner membrane ring subunit SctD n=1 Tax=Desulfocurvus vexinensis TaxID=399548 RepID=UPI000490CC65|nr:type III secretion system inner membrane ring subunit SctD [Desulfocurvus vexinensis]